MTSTEELAERLKAETAELHRLNEEIVKPQREKVNAIQRELVLSRAKYPVGTIMVDDRGHRARIAGYSYASYGDDWMYGVNIRKDGTDGERRQMYGYQNWKPLTKTVPVQS